MTRNLPAPKVPDLQQPGNYIDLARLGTAALTTYVSYPGIADGDFFYPNWRGCGAAGEVVDFFADMQQVINPGPEGMLLEIDNALLKALDQGWVFYSYRLLDPAQPNDPGEESARLFFYVGERSMMLPALAVAQCKESHDLHLDPALLEKIDTVSIVTPPYRAMLAGDKVTLTLDLYLVEDFCLISLVQSKEVTEEDVGQTLLWVIGVTELSMIEDGFFLMHYSVDYATPTQPTVSLIQRLSVVAPSQPMLPALTIEGFSGGSLDPNSFPDGLTLVIEPYPGMRIDDGVVLYASGVQQEAESLRTDRSNLDSGVLQFDLSYQWLLQNNGKEIEFTWQYAREGQAGSAIAHKVMIRKPLDLPPPEIDDAIIDGVIENGVAGHIFASSLVRGARVRIPDSALIGVDDTVQMHWDGYGITGSFIASPLPDDPGSFDIPASAVPANMGRHVSVYYEVKPVSQPSGMSKIFYLEVRRIKEGWPVIQIKRPPATDARIPLGSVPAKGAGLDLAAWVYMAQGQRVQVKAIGVLQAGGEERIDIRTGAAEPVTSAEHQAGEVSVILPKDFLARLKRNSETNRVTVAVSFDDGATYVTFPFIDFSVLD